MKTSGGRRAFAAVSSGRITTPIDVDSFPPLADSHRQTGQSLVTTPHKPAENPNGLRGSAPGTRNGSATRLPTQLEETGPQGRGPGTRARLALRSPSFTPLDVPGASSATKDGSHHANSRHRRSRLRRIDLGPDAPGTGPPGPGLRRRSSSAATASSPAARTGPSSWSRGRDRPGRLKRPSTASRRRPPRRDRRLPRLQERAPGRPVDERRRHAHAPARPQARPEGHLRLDRPASTARFPTTSATKTPRAPRSPSTARPRPPPNRWCSRPATASPIATPPPSASRNRMRLDLHAERLHLPGRQEPQPDRL